MNVDDIVEDSVREFGPDVRFLFDEDSNEVHVFLGCEEVALYAPECVS